MLCFLQGEFPFLKLAKKYSKPHEVATFSAQDSFTNDPIAQNKQFVTSSGERII